MEVTNSNDTNSNLSSLNSSEFLPNEEDNSRHNGAICMSEVGQEVEQATKQTDQAEVIRRLYSLEEKVELLREHALAVNREKKLLLAALQKIEDNDEDVTFTADQRDEIEATTERLICRCLTVEVSVTTPRTDAQEQAYKRVNHLLDEVEQMCRCPSDKVVIKLKSYLNACVTEPIGSVMDHRFQGAVLDCTVDDQKMVRHHLQELLDNINCFIAKNS